MAGSRRADCKSDWKPYLHVANVACGGPFGLFFTLLILRRWRLRPQAVAGSLEKEHAMPVGAVKFFNSDNGYGFIAPDGGGTDIFVLIRSVERGGMQTLNEDQRMNYEVETDLNG